VARVPRGRWRSAGDPNAESLVRGVPTTVIDLAPEPLESVRANLAGFRLPTNVLAHLAGSSAPATHSPPFLQLSYQEISESAVESAPGLHSITKSNFPIGLPRRFAPLEWPPQAPEILLFSLLDLHDHLTRLEPEVASHVLVNDRDSFMAANAGEAVTSFQYLVGGALDCIKFCLAHNWALSVRW
jgi:hypothetical protein